MARALFNGTVIAESDTTQVVEGNHYFPAESVNSDYLRPTDTTTVCGWKGTANYATVVVDGVEAVDAAWLYRQPKEAAAEIAGHYAFWRGVVVEA
jgi:uncharacterized protein (DUF427 family)